MEPGKIYIVGVGPGHPDYLLAPAAAIIMQAEVLAGGQRLLETFAADKVVEKVKITNNLPEVAGKIANLYKDKRVAVLASGDPGFYGILDYLSDKFPGEIIVVPGLSSFQVAAARLGLPWHNALLLSVHGRSGDLLPEISAEVKKDRLIFLLTGGATSPQVVARFMLEQGLGRVKVYLCEDLTYATEKITGCTFAELAGMEAGKNSLLVINSGEK